MINEIRLHQCASVCDGRRNHPTVYGCHLGLSLPDGGLKNLPRISARSQRIGALAIWNRDGKRRIKQKLFRRIPKPSKIQCQGKVCKGPITGICKGPGKILTAVGRLMIALYRVILIVKNPLQSNR